MVVISKCMMMMSNKSVLIGLIVQDKENMPQK